MIYLLAVLVCLPALVLCSNNTVTDEVYFDVKVDEGEPWNGRFVVGVFGDATPITAFNFISLAKGFKHGEKSLQQVWHYKNNMIHRIVPDFLLQTGDVVYRDGRGGRGVYAPYWIDENFIHSHRAAGMVAMANVGQDTNGSQFYITLTKARWLDGRNVVFGKVIRGMDVIERLVKVDTSPAGYPQVPVYITNCGLLPLKEPYDLTDEEMNKDKDVRSKNDYPDIVEL